MINDKILHRILPMDVHGFITVMGDMTVGDAIEYYQGTQGVKFDCPACKDDLGCSTGVIIDCGVSRGLTTFKITSPPGSKNELIVCPFCKGYMKTRVKYTDVAAGVFATSRPVPEWDIPEADITNRLMPYELLHTSDHQYGMLMSDLLADMLECQDQGTHDCLNCVDSDGHARGWVQPIGSFSAQICGVCNGYLRTKEEYTVNKDTGLLEVKAD